VKNFIIAVLLFSLPLVAGTLDEITYLNGDTTKTEKYSNDIDHTILIGSGGGVSCSYSDKTFLYSTPAFLSLDYHIKNGYYLQIAPKYSYLYRWSEYYLTLPLHVRKQISNRFSLYVGPCITWEIPYFRDLGISAGAYFHINKNTSIILSVFTFTLWDYYIDYTYIPIGVSFNYWWLRI
jgi:hypothetical protein